jgi:poly-gamma-glutamate capsule biosynthesis protein CapA/YwtB (metallophosphatase superfamily)
MPTSSNSKRLTLNQGLSLPLIFLSVLAIATEICAQKPPADRLHLIFAGDIMGHEPQILSAELEKNKTYDYLPSFEFVAPILQKADLAVGNLELTLPGKPPYTGYPLFKSPEALAFALRHAGFDVLTTANNHSNDAGPSGLISTLDILDKYGFYHTGTFRDSSEFQAFYPLIIYKNNFKLAFLNYTYDTNGLRTKPPTLVNIIDEHQIFNDLQTAKKLQPDFIIVIMHWGNEYQTAENQQQQDLASKMASWGADLIIGAHPHVVQPVREIADPTTNNFIWTAFSLGNFVSAQRKPETDGGMLLEVWLDKDARSGDTKLADLQFIPTWVWIESSTTGKKNFRIIPTSAFENGPADVPFPDYARAALKKHTANIRKRISIKEHKFNFSELQIEVSDPQR